MSTAAKEMRYTHTDEDIRELDIAMELVTDLERVCRKLALLTMFMLDICTSASRICWNSRQASSSDSPSAIRYQSVSTMTLTEQL